jgi:nicotinate-nucleotide adenylyltransferase
MLRAAVADDPRFTVVDLEIRRGGTTYTADTMAELHREHPDTDFRILLGADVARSIPAWHRAAELLTRDRFAIVNSDGETPLGIDEAMRLGFDRDLTQLLQVASPPVSASEVRGRAARGDSLAGLVPDAVATIIARDGLYRSGRAVHNAGG